jgi:hypothetical protein
MECSPYLVRYTRSEQVVRLRMSLDAARHTAALISSACDDEAMRNSMTEVLNGIEAAHVAFARVEALQGRLDAAGADDNPQGIGERHSDVVYARGRVL